MLAWDPIFWRVLFSVIMAFVGMSDLHASMISILGKGCWCSGLTNLKARSSLGHGVPQNQL